MMATTHAPTRLADLLAALVAVAPAPANDTVDDLAAARAALVLRRLGR
jgi:hypothetical protein